MRLSENSVSKDDNFDNKHRERDHNKNTNLFDKVGGGSDLRL